MKPILLILGILLAGGSAFWGYSVKQDLVKEGQANRQLVDENGLRDTVLRDTEFQRNEMEKGRDLAIQTQAQAAAELESATTENTRLTGELSDIKEKLAALDKELTEKLGEGDGADPQQLLAELEGLKASIQQKQDRKEELEALTEAGVRQLAPREADLAKVQERLASYEQSLGQNHVEYSITAVDPSWGFVILNAGESAGLDPAIPLIVFRNGQRQGLLNINTIERNQTVADIVPSSLKPGVRLQVGDKVIPSRPKG